MADAATERWKKFLGALRWQTLPPWDKVARRDSKEPWVPWKKMAAKDLPPKVAGAYLFRICLGTESDVAKKLAPLLPGPKDEEVTKQVKEDVENGRLLYVGQTEKALDSEMIQHLASANDRLKKLWQAGTPIEYACVVLNHSARILARAVEGCLLAEHTEIHGKLPFFNKRP